MNGSSANFSQNEKAFKLMTEEEEQLNDDQLAVEERCSALWNEIKDAGVLDGAELSNVFMAQLQSESALLDEQVQNLAQKSEILAANARLRQCSVRTALEELKRKKQRNEGENGESHEFGTLRLVESFRKWLKQKEAQLSLIKQRTAHSHNSESSLRELEQEQLTLQENIETEGRAKHQQLCNSSRSSQKQNKRQNDVDLIVSAECERLEHNYLALWLASLESLELIHYFSARLLKNCPEELLDSELEAEEQKKGQEEQREGPDPKRRKTNEEKSEEAMEQYEEENGTKVEGTKCRNSENQPQQQQQLTDIGYSSGENTSVHEGGTNTTVSEEMPEEEEGAEGAKGGQRVGGEGQPKGGEVRDEFMLIDNSELEKSFYRTVPLDEFGQTDLDTDEGNWPRSTYWAQRFMEEVEKTGAGKDGGTVNLTDSLIVHFDGPESREKLNDFEGVTTGLMDGRRNVDPFIEDECESQSTDDFWNGGGGSVRRSHPSSSTKTRKRALTRTLLLPPILTDQTVPAEKGKSRQSPRGVRRKCAAVRKTRSSTEGLRDRATNWTRWPNLSSDFEWDDEGYRRASKEDEMTTEIGMEKGDGDEQAIAIARKKALHSFRDSLFRAATQSGHVNVRLQELLALVDKSLGGVDSASFLLVELNNTFTALSILCRKLEQKMSGESANGGAKKMHEMDLLKEDMEAELLLCHERMNALETTCNNLALLLGGNLSGSEKNKSSALEEDERGDYLAQFANECSRIRKELQKLKQRFDRKFILCSTFAENTENAGGKWKNRTAEVRCAIQTSARDSVRPVHSPFWRSYLLLCLIGLIASFGALLFATSRDGTDWRWTFGPQLNYERGAPPF